ncbi:MAG: von Willebrand factor type A domain-containing protein [Verrucomicrobia bacterium]|nr:von Willebrand factor type A domain-containing protein [Verrucomicrobiota bacterium]
MANNDEVGSRHLGLTKTGSGTQTLSGANTYDGGTAVNAGKSEAKSSVAVTNTAPVSPVPPSSSSANVGVTGGEKTIDAFAGYADSPVVALGSKKSGAQNNKSNVAPDSAPEPALIASATSIGGSFAVRIESDSEARRRMPEEEHLAPQSRSANTATYRPIIENPFTFVAQQPLSTFSLDVDTASYANVRRLLNSGQRPPPNAVRLEELVNYFPYHYEGPAADRPIGVQVDLGEAPWQPLHRIARVAVKARKVKGERAAANFVFLLDVSGSMGPQERLPLIKQSLRLLVDQLREDDRVAIVTYAGESGLALESTSGAHKEKIRQAIQKLNSGGSTNGASGIRLAYEQAALNFTKEGINRVILCTDGDFNVGTSSVDELEKLIAEKSKGGVFLSVLGVGTDNLHDHTMQALADRGNGNYHYLDSVGEARKVLVEQMMGTLITVAKDVKLQVEFNPAQVAAYRLIGYEKRMLAKEKYPDGKPLVDDLKYALAPATKAALTPAASDESAAKPVAAPATNETMTVKVRYKEPDADQSKLFEVAVTDAHKKLSENDRDFQFAVSVAGFGMLLRGSPNANELTWEGVRRLALAGKGDDEQGWRGEFIQLIEKARGLCDERR